MTKKVKISSLIPTVKLIDTGAGHLEVRHLTLPEVVTVLTEHKDVVLAMLAATMSGQRPDFAGILHTAPEVCAIIIAHAADAADQIDDVKRLPPGCQLIAMHEIWKMSIPDPKALAAALQALTSMLPKGQPPSEKPNEEEAPNGEQPTS